MIYKQLCILILYSCISFESTSSETHSIRTLIEKASHLSGFLFETGFIYFKQKTPPWNENQYLLLGLAMAVNTTKNILLANIKYLSEPTDLPLFELILSIYGEAINESIIENGFLLGINTLLRMYKNSPHPKPKKIVKKESTYEDKHLNHQIKTSSAMDRLENAYPELIIKKIPLKKGFIEYEFQPLLR